jgi:hypothetical protein
VHAGIRNCFLAIRPVFLAILDEEGWGAAESVGFHLRLSTVHGTGQPQAVVHFLIGGNAKKSQQTLR